MRIETLGERTLTLANGHVVMYTLLRIDGQVVENRVLIICGGVSTAVLFPAKPTDFPELRENYPEANI